MRDLVFIALMAVGLGIYFLPAFCGMNKRNAGAIFALNLLLGWTLVGWVVALVWAFTVDAGTPAAFSVGALTPGSGQAWICGKCNAPLRPTDRFCPSCAAPVKWA